jgi:hypothetical protein
MYRNAVPVCVILKRTSETAFRRVSSQNTLAYNHKAINWLMLFKEITAVYPEDNMKPINALT